jgi:lysophospholipase L1-like esterase
MRKLPLCLVFFLVSLPVLAQERPFWNEIQAFKIQDSLVPPKDGMLLFIGSSSFRLWNTLQEDFNNPTIVNRAFGGATLQDMIMYQDAIALKYHPKKIFIYCGENDIASSEAVTPQIVLERFTVLYTSLRTQFPFIPIVYVSIKPCILRWGMRDRMRAANVLIQKYLNQQKHATFVNIWDDMLEQGLPKKDIFREDNLHMNAKGYAIWIKALSPLVH